MTNEYRRLSGSRACFIPLLITISFAVGYLTAIYRSQPGYSDIEETEEVASCDELLFPRRKDNFSMLSPVRTGLNLGKITEPMGNLPISSPVRTAWVTFLTVVNRSPVTSVNTNGPQKPPQPPQSGNIRQDPRRYPSRPDQPEPNAAPDEQNALPSGVSKGSSVNSTVVNDLTVKIAGGAGKSIFDTSPKSGIVKPWRQTLEYEIVVSHYNEQLDWLRPYAKQAGHVYHKGSERGPPFEMYKWERLPNVGRESHTYLYHIINNYHNLADVSVFLQGHGTSKDSSWCFAPMEFVHNAKRNMFCKKQGIYGGWGRISHFGKWLAELNSGKMRRATTTVGEFYTALFGIKPPRAVPACYAGCFSASRENLLRHPLTFYQKAITFVNDHNNPEEAHYLERLWATIINMH